MFASIHSARKSSRLCGGFGINFCLPFVFSGSSFGFREARSEVDFGFKGLKTFSLHCSAWEKFICPKLETLRVQLAMNFPIDFSRFRHLTTASLEKSFKAFKLFQPLLASH
jgi:hypothetical protein